MDVWANGWTDRHRQYCCFLAACSRNIASCSALCQTDSKAYNVMLKTSLSPECRAFCFHNQSVGWTLVCVYTLNMWQWHSDKAIVPKTLLLLLLHNAASARVYVSKCNTCYPFGVPGLIVAMPSSLHACKKKRVKVLQSDALVDHWSGLRNQTSLLYGRSSKVHVILESWFVTKSDCDCRVGISDVQGCHMQLALDCDILCTEVLHSNVACTFVLFTFYL